MIKFALQIFAAHVHGLWQAMHNESTRDFAI